MGERNLYLRYKASRRFADEQARMFKDGDELEGWSYESEWIPGMPEPTKLTMTGGAWVAHAYTIAAEDAELLASRDEEWQRVVDECKALAERFRAVVGCPVCQEWMLR